MPDIGAVELSQPQIKPKKITHHVVQEKFDINQALAQKLCLDKSTTEKIARSSTAKDIRIQRQRQEIKSAKEKSMIDAKTTLYNDYWLIGEKNPDGSIKTSGEIHRRISEAKRQEKPLYLLMWDLDHFKDINDTYGHLAGDDILRIVRLFSTRQEEPIVRYGGEEFIQLADENLQEEDIPKMIKRHMDIMGLESERILNDKNPKEGKEQIKKVTISFGIAKYEKGESPEELIKRADQAMYMAKQNGRNRAYIATTENGETTFKEMELPQLISV